MHNAAYRAAIASRKRAVGAWSQTRPKASSAVYSCRDARIARLCRLALGCSIICCARVSQIAGGRRCIWRQGGMPPCQIARRRRALCRRHRLLSFQKETPDGHYLNFYTIFNDMLMLIHCQNHKAVDFWKLLGKLYQIVNLTFSCFPLN